MAAPKRGGAGALNQSVTFQRRTDEFDEFGNVQTGPWTDQFTEPCRLTAKLGGEPVMAQRLVKRQPYIMTVRSSARKEALSKGGIEIPGRGIPYSSLNGLLDASRSVF